MKKTLVLITALLLLFTSCSEETGRNVILPEFGTSTSDYGRGLSDMTSNGAFEGNMVLACQVMSATPMVSTLRTVKIDPENWEYKIGQDSKTPYGITIKPILKGKAIKDGKPIEYDVSRINEDGVFIRYEILQDCHTGNRKGKTAVGYIDYYYSWEKETFSYRQYLLNTLNMGTMDHHITQNLILVYEMDNIKAKEMSNSFKAGQMEDGKLNQDAFHDFIFFFGDQLALARSYSTLYSKDSEIAAFTWTNGKESAPPSSWNNIKEGNPARIFWDEWIKENPGMDFGEYLYNLNVEDPDMNREFLFTMLESVYDNGKELIRSHSNQSDGRGYTYHSLEEFDKDTLRGYGKAKAEVWPAVDTYFANMAVTPMIYDARSCKGACTNTATKTNEFYLEEIMRTKEAFRLSGFNRFYNVPSDIKEGDEMVSWFTRKHLNRCGITDKEFINAYIEEVLKRPINH